MDKITAVNKWGSHLIRFFGAIYAFVGVALRAEIATGRHWVGMVSIGISLLVLGAITMRVRYRLEDLSMQQLLYGFLLLLIPQLILGAVMRAPHTLASIVLVVSGSRRTAARRRRQVLSESLG